MRLSPQAARDFLTGHHGLRSTTLRGAAGVRRLLGERRCIQLDPLDRIGTNADLVALARVDAIERGDVYRHLLPGHAFEHFAKERCLLPASAFAHYQRQAQNQPWWRLSSRHKRVPPEALQAVRTELREASGPLGHWQLSDLGSVQPIDWSGWKSTSSLAKMALEILAMRCEVVIAGRTRRGKVWTLPERLWPHRPQAEVDWARWALVERVEAAGLLRRASGPQWGMLRETQRSDLPEQLVAEGVLERVTIEGSRREYLAPAGFLERTHPVDDGRMRILGPLDPLIWDRELVKLVWDFEYLWEVYKPAAQRRWGYYVTPLLHEGQLVGRFEGHTQEGRVHVDQLWREPGVAFDERAFQDALERLSAAS